MAASNSMNMDENGVQTYNTTTGNLTGSAMTQYAVVCGDANNKIQNVSGLGSSGEVLTSNGAAALPTWQPSSNVGSGMLTYISTATASSSATLAFTGLSDAYLGYAFYISLTGSVNNHIRINCSTDNNSTLISANYVNGLGVGTTTYFDPQTGVSTPTIRMILSYYYLGNANNCVTQTFSWGGGNTAFLSSQNNVNAIRFTASTGTFASGTIHM